MVGKVFRKALRILALDGRKCRWVPGGGEGLPYETDGDARRTIGI